MIESPNTRACDFAFSLFWLAFMKKVMVMGIIGYTQGVSRPIKPIPSAIKKKVQRETASSFS